MMARHGFFNPPINVFKQPVRFFRPQILLEKIFLGAINKILYFMAFKYKKHLFPKTVL